MSENLKQRIREQAAKVAADMGAESTPTTSTTSTRRTVIVRKGASVVGAGYATTHDPAVGETTGVKGSAVRVLADGRRVLSDVVDHRADVGRVPAEGYAVSAVGVFGGKQVPVALTARGEWSTRSWEAGRWDDLGDACDAARVAVDTLDKAAQRWDELGRKVMADRVRAMVASVEVDRRG
jgi:hypothetical protein